MKLWYCYTPGRGKLALRNEMYFTQIKHRKGTQKFWLHCHDRHHALTQTHTNCAETHLGYGVLSPCWLPLLVNFFIACQFFIAWRCVHWDTTMMQPHAILCVKECEAKLFSVWKLLIQPMTDLANDWSLQESCKLLMAYSKLLLFQRILWATETALLWQNLCMYPDY